MIVADFRVNKNKNKSDKCFFITYNGLSKFFTKVVFFRRLTTANAKTEKFFLTLAEFALSLRAINFQPICHLLQIK